MESAKLYNGQRIPLVGLGTWKSKGGEVGKAVEHALKNGYRHIDCAATYGNEHEVGQALDKVFKDGVVKRDDIWITSKLWNSEHAQDRVEKACRKTINDLKCDYLNLYHMHWPVTGSTGELTPPIKETYQAMEALVDKGLVRSIGVSNFSIKKLKDLLSYARIKPAVVQIEVHPFFRNDEMIAFCTEHGIHVTAYSPLGSPDSALEVKRMYTPSLIKDELVAQLAKKYQKDAGQVLVRWAIQHGTSVLPKSVKPDRIVSNLDVFDFELSPEDFKKLSSLEFQMRMVDGSMWLKPEGPYRTLTELWDDPKEEERYRAMLKRVYNTDIKLPTAQLNTGARIPLIGLGTWKSAKGEVATAVTHALRAGYRHIDCAEIYGNEDEVGGAFSDVFGEGVVKREQVWVTSKLWNSDHAPEAVEPALRKTLKNLQLEYLDLYLIHWPSSAKAGDTVQPPIQDTWRAMEALHDKGLVKAIGVSNFSIKKLKDLLNYARIKPAVNQVEVHPYWRNDALIDYCRSVDVHVTAYSPLGSPDSADMYKRQNAPVLMQDPVVKEVAQKYGKSPAQILIRWGVQHGTSVLAKSVNQDRIKANLEVLTWQLEEQDYQRLCNLGVQMRMVNGKFLCNPNGPYRTEQDVWDEEQ